MAYHFSGTVPYTRGEARVWGARRTLGTAPILQNRFDVHGVEVPEGLRRVVVEHLVEGDVRRAEVVELTGPEIEVPEMTPGSTLRAMAWREAWEHGLGDRLHLIRALLPDEVGIEVRKIPEQQRPASRAQFLRALRVAMHAQRFEWGWDELDPALGTGLSTPVRTLLVVAVWRSVLRVSGIDRALVRLCEPAATALELRACRIAHAKLAPMLAKAGVTLPDPGKRTLQAWSLAVLFALRGKGEADPMRAAEICSEVAVAIDRTLDGIVTTALQRDEREVLRGTLLQQLSALQAFMVGDVKDMVPGLPGGWAAIAALWVSSLVGLGFNEDVDRQTEQYTMH